MEETGLLVKKRLFDLLLFVKLPSKFKLGGGGGGGGENQL